MTDVTYEVKTYLTSTFAPDIAPNELAEDYDIVSNGLIDSIKLLRVVSWISDRFDIPPEQVSSTPQELRTPRSIANLVDRMS